MVKTRDVYEMVYMFIFCISRHIHHVCIYIMCIYMYGYIYIYIYMSCARDFAIYRVLFTYHYDSFSAYCEYVNIYTYIMYTSDAMCVYVSI